MAQTQIKPKTSGAFTNVTGNGKTTTGISNLPPYALGQIALATNLYTIAQGAGARATTATKLASAVDRLLQWA